MEGLDKKDIYEMIDILTINMLDLMEQHIQCKINIEKRTNEGRLLLAKSRYTQGIHTVSSTQLPTENSQEFNALCEIKDIPANNIVGKELVLERNAINKDAGYMDPIKWFGILVPRSLHFAKERFLSAIEFVVECSNIQAELQAVISSLYKLKHLREKL